MRVLKPVNLNGGAVFTLTKLSKFTSSAVSSGTVGEDVILDKVLNHAMISFKGKGSHTRWA